ncbi:Cortical protein marker for cell polarity [Phycisphaerae bacterium RAS2]|nr:Cortical protein marker for cell polarity [Phycisphaerae bacterium RAS2]
MTAHCWTRCSAIITVALMVSWSGPYTLAADCPLDWREAPLAGGPNGPVYAMTTWDPDGTGPLAPWLVIGGSFTQVGGTSASRIAAWDGSAWHSFSSGMNTDVRALAVHEGELFAGGPFTSAGGSACNRVARWDGSAWQPLGSGLNEFVYSLASYNGELVVGGVFTNAGGTLVSAIARWSSGGGWQALGSGMGGPDAVEIVFALTVHDGSLIAAGQFQTAGGIAANRIARWDGAWHALGGGVTSAGTPQVLALRSEAGDLYAGGYFTHAGGAPCSNIARWDGAAWSPLHAGINGPVVALGRLGGDLIASGEFILAGGASAFRIARWNGASWQALGGGISATGRALASFAGDLHVGGQFLQVDSMTANYWARWGPACLRGDVDCNQLVEITDVDPFVQALLQSPGLEPCETFTADANGDGQVNGVDVPALVNMLF